jgi:transposase
LDDEVAILDGRIKVLVLRVAPALLRLPGIGIHCAAQLLVTSGDNPDRLLSDAAFAALCGVSPVEASSGQTIRHRLNRGGDRRANNALWTIAHVRLTHDQRTRDYAAKRQAGGDSRKGILRMLKRYIAREVFAIIIAAIAPRFTSRRLT